jgi:hypothetical protein
MSECAYIFVAHYYCCYLTFFVVLQQFMTILLMAQDLIL